MINDCEGLDFLSQKVQKTRKPRRCAECRRTIPVGELYEYSAGKFDGDFVTYFTCNYCMIAKEWLSRQCGGYVFTMVLEDVQDHVEYDNTGEAAKLVAGMRRAWQDEQHREFAVQLFAAKEGE